MRHKLKELLLCNYNYNGWLWQSKWHVSSNKPLANFNEVTVHLFLNTKLMWPIQRTTPRQSMWHDITKVWTQRSQWGAHLRWGQSQHEININPIYSINTHSCIPHSTIHQCTLIKWNTNICLCNHSLKCNYLFRLFFSFLPASHCGPFEKAKQLFRHCFSNLAFKYGTLTFYNPINSQFIKKSKYLS